MSIKELWKMTMKCLLVVGALALSAYATYAEDPEEEGLQSVLNNPNDRMPQPCLLRDNRVSPEEMTQARIKGTFRDDEKGDYAYRSPSSLPADHPDEVQNRHLYRVQRAAVLRAREVCREEEEF